MTHTTGELVVDSWNRPEFTLGNDPSIKKLRLYNCRASKIQIRQLSNLETLIIDSDEVDSVTIEQLDIDHNPKLHIVEVNVPYCIRAQIAHCTRTTELYIGGRWFKELLLTRNTKLDAIYLRRLTRFGRLDDTRRLLSEAC